MALKLCRNIIATEKTLLIKSKHFIVVITLVFLAMTHIYKDLTGVSKMLQSHFKFSITPSMFINVLIHFHQAKRVKKCREHFFTPGLFDYFTDG